MAIVSRIKCYKEENFPDPISGKEKHEVQYHARCDTIDGQVDAWAPTEKEAMSELKNMVQETGLEWPDNLIPKDTGKNSTVYAVGEPKKTAKKSSGKTKKK